MRIFVTGATGFIGSAVVDELLAAGHAVVGLARNAEAAAKLKVAGAESHPGSLSDLTSLAAGALASDAVVHLAFIHDFSKFEENVAVDRRAAEAMTHALKGSGKGFVLTSGTAMVSPGRIATEDDTPADPTTGRAATEQLVLSMADHDVRSSVVRLSPTVHGKGDGAFVPMLIELARQKGFAAFIGSGDNRWPAVHRLDAAVLFRLAVETAAPGTRLHGAAEEGIPMREIAQTIGDGLGVPVRSLSPDEAHDYFGWFAGFVGLDGPTSSAMTRETTGWAPTQKGLLLDMRHSGYFSSLARDMQLT